MILSVAGNDGTRGGALKILFILVAALYGASCIPPSCMNRSSPSLTPTKYYVGVTVFAKPIKDPKTRYSTGVGTWELYASGASIRIDGNGAMAVSTLSMWPRSCSRIPREDLEQVSRYWEPVLEKLSVPHCAFVMMQNPPTGNKDWRPDGPMMEFSFVSPSGKSLEVLWDGQTSLPKDVDTAVLGTLELMRSRNRLARKYLLRDLPPQLTRRLEREKTVRGSSGPWDGSADGQRIIAAAGRGPEPMTFVQNFDGALRAAAPDKQPFEPTLRLRRAAFAKRMALASRIDLLLLSDRPRSQIRDNAFE